MAIVGWSKVYGFGDVNQLPILDLNGVIVEFAGHHFASQHMFDNSDLFAELRDAGLFNGNSFAANGAPLPRTAQAAAAVGSAYHAGPHTEFSRWQAARPARLEADLFKGGCCGQGCALAPRSCGSPLTAVSIMKQCTTGEAA